MCACNKPDIFAWQLSEGQAAKTGYYYILARLCVCGSAGYTYRLQRLTGNVFYCQFAPSCGGNCFMAYFSLNESDDVAKCLHQQVEVSLSWGHSRPSVKSYLAICVFPVPVLVR